MDRPPLDRDYIERHHLVERYIRRELSDEEAVEFEQFFLNDQQTQQELEAELLLADELSNLSSAGSATIPLHPKTTTSSSNTGWLLGASAAALVMLVVGNLAGSRNTNPAMVAVGQGLFVDGALRGDSEERSIGTLCIDQAATISLKAPGSGPYIMTLSQGGEAYYRIADQTVAKHSATNELQVFLSTDSLPAGPNRFELIEQGTGQMMVGASFNVDPDC